MFNQKILNLVQPIIDNTEHSRDDVLGYLLSLSQGFTLSFIPLDLMMRIEALELYTRNKKGKITWKEDIPIFFAEEDKTFLWIHEKYIPLFKKKGGYVLCTKKMVKLFSQNTFLNKEQVLIATKKYLEFCEENKIQPLSPPYFILKGGKSELLKYIS